MDSQERSDRIARRFELLLVKGCRCFSQAFYQAERMIDNQKHLSKPQLRKIKDECQDECCDPWAYEVDWFAAQKLEYEHERLPKYDKDEERRRVPFENYYDPEQRPWSLPSATSSATLGSANTVASPEAATEHSQLPRAATGIPEAKLTKKSRKETFHCTVCPWVIPSAASSANLGSTNTVACPEAATEHSQFPEAATAIPEAATGHSEIQKLLMLANAASPEVATEHFQIPAAATTIPEAKRTKKSRKETFLCQEITRPWKKGKGTGSHKRTTSPDPTDIAG